MKLITGIVPFERQTNELLTQLLGNLYTKNLKKAEREVRNLVKNKLLDSATAKSLMGMEQDSLMGHFGIPIGEEDERVENIIDTISEFVRVRVSRFPPTRTKVRANISITLGDEVYPELINLDDGQVLTEKGEVIYWLEWLLLGGFLPLIENFHVEFQLGKGRSGQAIMVPQFSWSIPSEHGGTRNNNWLTRELQDKEFIDLVASTTYRILNS